ncbi:MAG TPA: hypothetical protein VKC60_00970 [Opitutaceae bacterium]|nr:hypothetical protein [Opitutaceae bacterium]
MKIARLALLSFVGLLVLACADKKTARITGPTFGEYNVWVGNMRDTHPRDTIVTIEQAARDIKLGVMFEQTVAGTKDVDEAFYKKVSGLNLDEFLLLGIQTRITRLETLRNQYQELADSQAKVHTKPGDEESATYLAHRIEDNRVRLDKANQDLAEAKAQLAKLKAPSK